SGVPMLVGMAVTFAVVATLAAVAGGWAVKANQYGRAAAIMLLAMFGLTLIFPRLADHLAKPFVTLGARLSQSVEHADATQRSGLLPSLLLGVATGLLWLPCAGPVLGLILSGAALRGASHWNVAAAAGIRGKGRHVVGASAARRRPRLRRNEAVARGRRMGPARLGSRGARCSCDHRATMPDFSRAFQSQARPGLNRGCSIDSDR